MKHTSLFPHSIPTVNWQCLGELEVHAGPDVEHAIQVWLTESLNPLELQADLPDRVFRSIVEATRRALQLQDVSNRFGHIHLLAYAPPMHISQGQTWGFFRLEKLESNVPGKILPDYAIELYLYTEGQSDSANGAMAKR